MELESKLWDNVDQNKLHIILNNSKIKYLLYNVEEILFSAKLFLNDYEKNIKYNLLFIVNIMYSSTINFF
mgnify:CR=1 FL=1